MKKALVLLMVLATTTTVWAATKIQLEERVSNHINTISKLDKRGKLEQLSQRELKTVLTSLKTVIKTIRGQQVDPIHPPTPPAHNKKVSAKQLLVKLPPLMGTDEKTSRAFRLMIKSLNISKLTSIYKMCKPTSSFSLERRCFATEISEIGKPLNISVQKAKAVSLATCKTTPNWEKEVTCFKKAARIIGKPALVERVSDCKNYSSSSESAARCMRNAF